MTRSYIIAEAGVNHNGSMELARKLVHKAKECGADAVKFQTFKATTLVTRDAGRAEYQIANTKNNDTQFEMIQKLELSREAHLELKELAEKLEIDFLSSPFDLDSIDFLGELELPLLKIPSGEITNYPFLKKVSEKFKKIILSTGMSSMQEIIDAVGVLDPQGNKDLTILHCNTEYPTPMGDVNLAAMNTIGEKLKRPIGYSDHTMGIEVPIAAVAMGATVIEKHFTLDNKLPGPDHLASLEPEEFSKMVTGIRNIEVALGTGQKEPTESEKKNIPIVRKSIVAKTMIKKGEILTADNITVKRPGNGRNPMQWPVLLGTLAEKDYAPDELI